MVCVLRGQDVNPLPEKTQQMACVWGVEKVFPEAASNVGLNSSSKTPLQKKKRKHVCQAENSENSLRRVGSGAIGPSCQRYGGHARVQLAHADPAQERVDGSLDKAGETRGAQNGRSIGGQRPR